MKLHKLLKFAGIDVPPSATEREITGIVCDSRQVRPGALFVALAGRTHDGLAFIEDAVSRGAVAVLSADTVKVPGDVTALSVSDPRAGFAELSAAFHGYPARALRVCGITGTNGKTTVSFMVRDMLRRAGWTPGLIGTVHYEIGSRTIPAARTTPDAAELQSLLAQMRQVGCRSAVMEASSHAIDQKRVWAVAFDVGVFTNLTRDHLDYHGDMETYFQAKRLFFERLGSEGKPATAVVNLDNPAGRRLAFDSNLKVRILTYGIAADADIRAEAIVADAAGSRVRLHSPWGEHSLHLRLPGQYNVSNALAAIAAGGAMGLDPGDMLAALEALTNIPGRLEEIHEAKSFRVFVDYAHTDDALANVLKTLRPLTSGRLIVVFGCGGNRDRSKREAMGAAAARGADVAIVTTDNPRKEDPASIISEIVAGFPDERRCHVALDRREAIQTAFSIAAAGDVVLIAGKGHETFQEFAHTIIPFDDREVARSLLRAMRARSGAKAPTS